MFNFFDNDKNPFMYMMNMMNMDSPENGAEPEKEFFDAGLTQMMQKVFALQMQTMRQTMMTHMEMIQLMCMMPMQLTQGFLDRMDTGKGSPDPDMPGEAAAAGHESGFKLGNLEIPPELLSRLMQMDMSPENLEKLQRLLDFVFNAMPQPKQKSTVRQEEK